MANPLYARLQATADRLIKSFGQQGTVTHLAPPDQIEGGDPVETTYPAKLVPMAYDRRYIDGSTVQEGDVQIYISAIGLAIRPQVGDVVTCGGIAYHVVGNDPNNYDSATDVVHIVHART